MTQEEKELLVNDLSARLPYGVMIQTPESFHHKRKVLENKRARFTFCTWLTIIVGCAAIWYGIAILILKMFKLL